ncbi:hypothetical protein EIP91_002985 [Steccherinum ochraceum]|uniref:DUF6534 domain-containing protein n=1 Tax=Steccherinum ochraceum TaxID=92696 RepID=A0A4R0RJM7_9APHY|nr:hypothetical protein EIP91_002985 [Steccherinum ochraceum]
MSSAIPADISVLTGPVLFADLVNWGLFGALTVQVYLYYISFPQDKPLIKAVVYTTYSIEVVQTALATREAFRILAIGWGNPDVLVTVGWLGITIPCLVSVLTWISQMFYAWRIWILRRTLWLPIIIAMLSLTQMICGLISGIHIQLIGILAEVEARTSKTTTVRLVCALVCDVVIATSMLQFLYGTRNTAMQRTQNIVSRLIKLTFETGLILMLVAVIDLTFFLAFPQNNFFYAPSMSLSKLYSNAMLVMLNVRIEVVGGRSKNPRVDVELSDATISTSLPMPTPYVPGSTPKASLTFDG